MLSFDQQGVSSGLLDFLHNSCRGRMVCEARLARVRCVFVFAILSLLPRLRFELCCQVWPILSVKILKSSLLKCSRFRENGGIRR